MPAYNATLLPPQPEIAIPGKPAYFWGSQPANTDDTYMRISSVSITSNVASVTGTIYRGNIPAVGNQVSIQGTASNSGIFNVTAAAITGVTGTPSTGVYTLTFALTHADVSATADSGQAIIPIAEVSEALVNGASVAIYVPSNELRDLGQRSITVAVTFPSLPTAATIKLRSAIANNPFAADPEWTDMGTVATVAAGALTVPANASTNGGIITFATPAGRFFRLENSSVSGGTSPTICAKMIC